MANRQIGCDWVCNMSITCYVAKTRLGRRKTREKKAKKKAHH